MMLESILVSKVTITFSQSVSKILYDKLRMVIHQHECMVGSTYSIIADAK